MKNKIFGVGLLFAISCGSNAQSGVSYSIQDNFIASGYMGDIKNIIVRRNFKENNRPDSACTKIIYSSGDSGWGGVYWQYPANNWCTTRGKDFSMSGYTKVTFMVKGEKGGEEVKFKVGQDCGDSFVSDELTKKLTTAWIKVTIDLGKDLSNIRGAFCWVVDSHANDNVVTFYIDDIQFEK